MNTTYRLTWVIDLDADSPEAAARQALAIQRDPESIALVFDVEWHNGRHIDSAYIDLMETDDGET